MASTLSAHAVGWRRERQPLFAGIPAELHVHNPPEGAMERCWELLHGAEAVLSAHLPTSELRRLSAAPDPSACPLSPLLAEALAAAAHWWKRTCGACDANAGALIAVWRAAVAAGRPPSPEAIAEACARGGCSALAVEGGRLRSPCPPVMLDLGGIAKGLLVDLVDAVLVDLGVEDALVQLGGETSCRGRAPHGGPWRVGVQHPVLPGRAWCVLESGSAGLSCSTSGDGRRSAHINGVPVAHLIDPRTGVPLSEDLLIANISAPRAGRTTACEALTKAACFLERAQASRIIAAERAEAVWLEADDAGILATCTEGWRWGRS